MSNEGIIETDASRGVHKLKPHQLLLQAGRNGTHTFSFVIHKIIKCISSSVSIFRKKSLEKFTKQEDKFSFGCFLLVFALTVCCDRLHVLQ